MTTWQIGALAGLIFGVLTVGACLVTGAGTGFVFGVVAFSAIYSVVMGAWLTRMRRRFDPIDGPALTTEERADAIAAIKHGRLADDIRAREASLRIAEWRLRRPDRPTALVLTICFFALLSAAIAAAHPAYWLLVAFWIVFGPVAIRADRRARQRARVLLAAAGAGHQSRPDLSAGHQSRPDLSAGRRGGERAL